MGGTGKRAASIGASVIRGVFALLIFILALLLVARVAAGFRERGAAAPAGTQRFTTPSGAVAARVVGRPDGPSIVLVHGTAAWSGFWKDVADHLASRGWRVVAIDLPPFGWSDHDPQRRYDRIAQAERLNAVLKAQRRPAVVVAHSFGAGAATELALRHPDEVRALVLVDAALGELDPKGEGAAARLLSARPVAEAVTSAGLTNPAALEPLLRSMIVRKDMARRWLPVLRQPMRRKGTTSAYAAWLPSLFAKDDGALSRRSDRLSAIRVPVALIWGGADSVTPLEQGRRISALTRARSLTVIPGVGHIPHIEDPQAFQAALDRALINVSTEGK